MELVWIVAFFGMSALMRLVLSARVPPAGTVVTKGVMSARVMSVPREWVVHREVGDVIADVPVHGDGARVSLSFMVVETTTTLSPPTIARVQCFARWYGYRWATARELELYIANTTCVDDYLTCVNRKGTLLRVSPYDGNPRPWGFLFESGGPMRLLQERALFVKDK